MKYNKMSMENIKIYVHKTSKKSDDHINFLSAYRTSFVVRHQASLSTYLTESWVSTRYKNYFSSLCIALQQTSQRLSESETVCADGDGEELCKIIINVVIFRTIAIINIKVGLPVLCYQLITYHRQQIESKELGYPPW